MYSPSFRYLLFPHTIMSENRFRSLSVLLPQLSLFQPVRPAPIPAWGGEQFWNLSALDDEELTRRAGQYLKGLEDMAAVQGTGSVLASIMVQWDKKDVHESRFGIQSRLRGAGSEAPDPEELLRIESAVFLELARTLDEREIDLEASLAEAGKLEGKFREILGGVGDGELKDFEIEELTGPGDSPLAADRSGLPFMLSRRLRDWYRLYATGPVRGPMVPIALNGEVIEEIMESVRNGGGAGRGPGFSELSLAVIPALDSLEPRSFLKLHAGLRDASGPLSSYWKEMERAIGEGGASVSGEGGLEAVAGRLREQVEQFLIDEGVSEKKMVELVLVRFENVTHESLWEHFDKLGFDLWEGAFPPMGPVSAAVLCLTGPRLEGC